MSDNNDNKNISALRDLLMDSAMLGELESNIDDGPNIFSILKVDSTEIRHSNFLSWALDPNENHGLSQAVIEGLLKWYAEMYATDDAAVSLLLADGLQFRVLREWQHIDLIVVSDNQKIIFAIENKVYSTEHSKQLQRYYETIIQHYPDYKCYFLYLTLQGDEPPYMEDIWNPIGYETIATLLEETITKTALSPEVALLLNHYIDTIRRLVAMENPQIKELCNKIYAKHKTALDLIYQNINVDERPELTALSEWVAEWAADDKCCCAINHISNNQKWYEFSTTSMDGILPPIDGEIAYKYFINAYNYPFEICMELQSPGIIGTVNFDKADAIVQHIEHRSVTNPKNSPKGKPWRYHRLKKWRVKPRNLDSVDFDDISDEVKVEMEDILNISILEFEAELEQIVAAINK